jgi:lipoprotein-releasing system permease protein
MFYPFSTFVGLRYTRSKRRSQFVSMVSFFSLLGMVLGVAALIIVMSVMNGFESELRGRILQFLPHVFIEEQQGKVADWQNLADNINKQPNVLGVAPYIEGNGLISQHGKVDGIHLSAIYPQLQSSVSNVDAYMIDGSIKNLMSGQFGIVIGAITARKFRLNLGDKVAVVLPKVTVTPAGIFPRVKQFTVVGVFELGAALDSVEAFIHLDDGAKLFGVTEGVQGVRVKTTDVLSASTVASKLQSVLGQRYEVSDWGILQGNLFKAVKMEKLMVGLLLFVIVAVAAFNIISILTMMVADKRADIAVLRTMGAQPNQVMQIFVTQGVIIGFGGTLLGVLFGVPLALYIGDIISFLEQLFQFRVFDPSIFFITTLPSVLHWQDVLAVVIGALTLSFTATLYPSWRATQVEPAEVLRYE